MLLFQLNLQKNLILFFIKNVIKQKLDKINKILVNKALYIIINFAQFTNSIIYKHYVPLIVL